MATILIVDDRLINREFLTTLLAYKGYRLLEAADGAAALALVQAERPDLVISDLLMPTMDGYEFVRQLRSSAFGRELPVIFYSARYHQEELGPLTSDLGVVLFLAKPTAPELILRSVEKMLQPDSPHRPAPISEEFEREHLQLLTNKLASQVEKLEVVNHRLNALLALGQRVALQRDPLQLLATFCAEAGQLTEASHAAIAVFGEDQQEFAHFFTSQVSADHHAPPTAPPAQSGLLSELLRKGRPVRLRELERGPDIAGCPARTSSLLGLPLATPTRTYGLLYFTGKRGADEFTEEDEQIARTLAAQLAISYENARRLDEIARHAAALTREVSERKQAQEQALRSSEEVTAAQVREGVLRQRAQQLVENNRAKDEFLGTVSHELRTPLTSILGWTDILRSGEVDAPTQKHGLEVIERNARLQVQLVEDLIDISRIISGKMTLTVCSLSLVPIIEAAIETVTLDAAKKSIRLESFFATEVPPVNGDATRLQQVVSNLLANAIKFTPKFGRVALLLSFTDSHVSFSVSDNGIGIDPDFLPYVFERFRQADTTSTRHYTGLGIGLAIVRQLVEHHGGTVSVQSAGKGQGSTFVVTLPLATYMTAPPPESGLAPAPASAEINTARLAGLTVLLVEDVADSYEVLSSLLRQAGLTVVGASSAEEALAQLDQHTPHLLVSDIGLPGEDGFALIRKLRSRPAERGGSIPAIALTAYARLVDRSQILASGFQAHLAKPVERTALLSMILSLVPLTKTS